MKPRLDLPALRELGQQPQWVCWRLEKRGEKETKVPYDPRTGSHAQSNNPATWASYREAMLTWRDQPQRYQGIGYMFAGDITGIDLDHCIDEHGVIEPWALAILGQMASYAERSPSQRGIHILVRGTIKKSIRRGLPHSWGAAHPKAAIEMYCRGRYFTVTGMHLEESPKHIEHNQEALDTLSTRIVKMDGQLAKASLLSPEASALLADDALLEKAMQANNGGTFRTLFLQGANGYPSASEADLALCLLLAFWTGRDLARMDRLFRRSALYREKWESPRGESSYGQETLQKALRLCQQTYDPDHSSKQREKEMERLLAQVVPQTAFSGFEIHQRETPLFPKRIETPRVLQYLEENEYGDARFFAEAFSGQACYDHSEKEWYLWQGHFWKRDQTGTIRQLVAGVLGSLYLHAAADLNTELASLQLQIQTREGEASKGSDEQRVYLKEQEKTLRLQTEALRSRAKALRSVKRVHAVLTFVKSEMGITSERWDKEPWFLPVANGVIDLRTGVCRDGNPEDYLRTIAPTQWTGSKTPCPRFERFLEEIFEDKPDREVLIAFLGRLLGYGITGLTTHHLFPMFYGEEGRNGKDTLLDTLKAVLGPLVGAVSNDVFLSQDRYRTGGAATPHLCDLQGKRLVWGSETKEGDQLNVAQIKWLTGGGAISARQLHGKQYSFTPTHKLLLMTNHKPHADAREKAFWARAALIDFGMRFVDKPQAPHERKADPNLKETLREEASGILAWQDQGLALPASVQLATERYREEEDKLLLFIQESCVLSANAFVKAGAFFSAYKSWYETTHFGGRGMNSKLFGEEMKKRFSWREDKHGRYYLGIGLRASEHTPGAFLEKSPGSAGGRVEGEHLSQNLKQTALEAAGGHTSREGDGGSGGTVHVFSSNQKNPREKETTDGESLHSLLQLTEPPQNALTSQAGEGQIVGQALCASILPPAESSMSSTPCWEKPRKAVGFSPGLSGRENTCSSSTEEAAWLLKQVKSLVQTEKRDHLFWRGEGSGYENWPVSIDEYKRRVEECCKSGDSQRIEGALNAMKNTLEIKER